MPAFLKQFDPALAAAAGKAALESGALSTDQFNVLVDLLTPGYELSTLMLADYKSQHPTKVEPTPPNEATS
jgi:hypothetical protein